MSEQLDVEPAPDRIWRAVANAVLRALAFSGTGYVVGSLYDLRAWAPFWVLLATAVLWSVSFAIAPGSLLAVIRR